MRNLRDHSGTVDGEVNIANCRLSRKTKGEGKFSAIKINLPTVAMVTMAKYNDVEYRLQRSISLKLAYLYSPNCKLPIHV